MTQYSTKDHPATEFLKLPAIFINTFHPIGYADETVRLDFGEICLIPDEPPAPVFRVAVAMSGHTLRNLHDLLGKIIEAQNAHRTTDPIGPMGRALQ